MKVIFLLLVLIVSVLGDLSRTSPSRNRHENGQRGPIRISSIEDWYASIRTRANLIADKLRRDLKKKNQVYSPAFGSFLDFVDTIPRTPESAGTAVFLEQQLVDKHSGKGKVAKCHYVPANLHFKCVEVLRVSASKQFYNI
ncbi:uncharacterized protein LOC141855454 [Brevipalpus obovatus]|uniref:uncharacterized protein LOC141855454 n=1 Tax=Brevipalpus obovatus TaxID=246614 RepID=UPI003D9EBC0B